MKMFLIVLILVSSTAAALFFSLQLIQESPQEKSSKEASDTLAERIHENFSRMRRITKEADIQDLSLFLQNSSRLLKEIESREPLCEEFKKEYSKLFDIVNQTALSIQSKQPALSQKLQRMKAQFERFDRKIKSIGLPELKTNWYEMQKLYRQFMREPSVQTFQSYRLRHVQAKSMITELYLDDADEEQLFAFLDHHYDVLSDFQLLYNDVGMENICQLKPLMYQLKEKIQLKAPLFEKPAL